VLDESGLSDRVKAHLRAQLDALPRSRLLFIRRRVRRSRPGLKVYFAASTEREPRLLELELERYEDLLELDFTHPDSAGESLGHPLLVVCTHGKRDRCCALHGRALYDRLRSEAEREWVWQSTHVGGDRFAGNVVFLPEGLYFGRVGPEDVRPLLDRYAAGEVWLESYRGRSCYPFAVQAAERAIREATGILGVRALELAGLERSASGWRVGFRAVGSGETYEADVRSEPDGEPAYLTCAAATRKPARRYLAG
jgi:hypothetical protein